MLGTLNRKKERVEVEQLVKESALAISSASQVLNINDIKDYELEEGEERLFIEKSSQNSESIQSLMNKLMEWINSELTDERIIVKDLADDMCDGMILQKLVEKLANIKMDHPELIQSKVAQLLRLRRVISTINQILGVSETPASELWTAEKINNKDLIAILRLLVAIVYQFKPEMHLKPGCFINVIVAKMTNGILEYRYDRESVTGIGDYTTDTLDVASGNIMVKNTVISFVNHYLKQLHFEVKDLSKDLCDGVMLILVMGLLGGYYVPFYAYNPTPTTEAMRLANVKLVFELMGSAGMPDAPVKPEAVVAGEGDAILRVLYAIYIHYTSS